MKCNEKKPMEDYIVKIKSYYHGNVIEYGTGLVISDRLILTAEHVVAAGEKCMVEVDGEELEAVRKESNGCVTLLEIRHSFQKWVEIFSIDEILDEDSEWSVSGFVGSLQIPHAIEGKGFYLTEGKGDWDYSLIQIQTGETGDYKGMSGSPVLCDGRIVGILQMQASNQAGKLGLRMSSTEMFSTLLPQESFRQNRCMTELRKKLTEYTEEQIEKNRTNKKYISDIFVEERDYKEKIRYFADPALFLRKAVKEVRQFDFSKMNEILLNLEKEAIDFTDLETGSSGENIEEAARQLMQKLELAGTKIRELDHVFQGEEELDVYFDKERNALNSSVRYLLMELQENVEYCWKKYVLLTKKAGQGKTNFLCDFTSNFLLKKGYLVLYYNAYIFSENPMKAIQRQLTVNGQFDMEDVHKLLLREWKKTARPLVIVIDGLNENTSIKNFGQCMREFLEECETYPYLKVLMTTRNEFFTERFGILEEGDYREHYCRLDMEDTTDEFKDRIFWGYLSHFDISVRDNAISKKAYRMLTDDILLLRFFCEVKEHQKQIYLYDIYKYEVFQEYLDKKSQEYQANEIRLDHENVLLDLLNKIVKYMIDHKTFHYVPVRIFDKEEEKLLLRMLNNEMIFKDEQVAKAGILQKKSMMIGFAFDEFRDYCITNYVLEHLAEQGQFLNFWVTMNAGMLTIREGVQKYIFYLSMTKYRADLGPMVEALPEYEELYWNYIWDVEECYLSKKDAQKWKREVLEQREHDSKVTDYLVRRYDCDSFRNLNIRMLFEMLDEWSCDMGKYRQFTREMFGVERKNIYGRWCQGEKTVWPYNRMLDDLYGGMRGKRWVRIHQELFRMTIYLYELKRSDTLKLWKKLYDTDSDSAVVLLQEMNGHRSTYLKGNVNDILEYLLEQGKAKRDERIQKLYHENSYTAEFEQMDWGEWLNGGI